MEVSSYETNVPHREHDCGVRGFITYHPPDPSGALLGEILT